MFRKQLKLAKRKVKVPTIREVVDVRFRSGRITIRTRDDLGTMHDETFAGEEAEAFLDEMASSDWREQGLDGFALDQLVKRERLAGAVEDAPEPASEDADE